MNLGSPGRRTSRPEQLAGAQLGTAGAPGLTGSASPARDSSGATGYGPSGYGPPPADPAQLAGQDVEYRLSREFRRPLVSRLIISLIVTAALASLLGSPFASLAYFAGSISAAVASWNGAAYLWRGRFRTTVTGRGIEMRGYFNHFVLWDQVRGIEVARYGSRNLRLDDTLRPQVRVSRRKSYRSYRGPDARSTAGKLARLATIRVVRTSGRKLLLRAPIVTGWASDPFFSDKARQLQQLCTMYGGPAELRDARRSR
jgi:hypothetical protein